MLDIPQSFEAMTPFHSFVTWAGSQRQAADALGLSESMVSLVLSGKRPLQPQHAIRAESASGGFFRADDLLPTHEFVRNEAGEIVGSYPKAKQSDS